MMMMMMMIHEYITFFNVVLLNATYRPLLVFVFKSNPQYDYRESTFEIKKQQQFLYVKLIRRYQYDAV